MITLFENFSQKINIAHYIKKSVTGSTPIFKIPSFNFDKFNDKLSKTDAGRCKVVKVECFENDNNSSIYEEI